MNNIEPSLEMAGAEASSRGFWRWTKPGAPTGGLPPLWRRWLPGTLQHKDGSLPQGLKPVEHQLLVRDTDLRRKLCQCRSTCRCGDPPPHALFDPCSRAVGDKLRDYVVLTPRGYNKSGGHYYPLLMYLHSQGGSVETEAAEFFVLATEYEYIAVAPRGIVGGLAAEGAWSLGVEGNVRIAAALSNPRSSRSEALVTRSPRPRGRPACARAKPGQTSTARAATSIVWLTAIGRRATTTSIFSECSR